jgi:hypothetical protein
MSQNEEIAGSLNRELEDPKYSDQFEREAGVFALEVQILNVMEDKSWTYSKLADAVNTSKGNISRDLKGGGLAKATFSRVQKICGALGMSLIALVVPKEHAEKLTWRFHEMIRKESTKPANYYCTFDKGAFGEIRNVQSVGLMSTWGGIPLSGQIKWDKGANESRKIESIEADYMPVESKLDGSILEVSQIGGQK